MNRVGILPSMAISVVMVTALALPSVVTAEGEAASLGFSPSIITADAGDTIALEVTLDCSEETRGTQFSLQFDASRLRCDSFAAGDYYSSWASANGASVFPVGFPPTIDNSNGTVSNVAFALFGGTGGPTGSGVLATCEFTAIGEGEATVSFLTYDVLNTSAPPQEIPASTAVVTVGVTGSLPADQLVLHLKTGWNMVSIPLLPGDPSPSSVFPGADAVYAWNPVDNSYSIPLSIRPEKGYWVAYSQDTTITPTGMPVTEWTDSLMTQGWHMVGSAHGTTEDFTDPQDVANGSVEGFAYWWNPTTRSYVFRTTIEPGKGYWAAVARDCTLSMGFL